MKKAIILDKFQKKIRFSTTEVVQCISKSNFSLLEVYEKTDKQLLQEIDTSDKKVKRIPYNFLSNIAKKELSKAVEKIINEDNTRFVNFFNNARPIGLRRHQLDLLPMIGKKHRIAIIEHREKHGDFNSFEDIKKVPMMPDPAKVIISRIIDEIEGVDDKFHFFTIPHFKKRNN